MDELSNKRFFNADYLCRYTGVPYYYNNKDGKDVFGMSQNLLPDLAWVAHQVKPEDTLDSLALNYYNNPTYWWIIAFFNNINDPLDVVLHERYEILKIPGMTNLEFGDLR